MNDLATLGIAIDSSPAAKAATDLEKLTTAAVRAEDAVKDLGDSSSTALKEVGKGTAPLPAALKEVETSARSAGKTADGMVSTAFINQMKQFEASPRSGAKSTAELEVQRSQLRSLQKAVMLDNADAKPPALPSRRGMTNAPDQRSDSTHERHRAGGLR
jgi:hypothetical protein